MKIGISNINELSEDKIFDSIKNIVDNIYNSFDYLNIELEELYNQARIEIRNSKKNI